MRKKLTITIDRDVYDGLQAVVGRGNISRFIEDLVRPYVVQQDLDAAYREMAQDEERETSALEWAEATIRDQGAWHLQATKHRQCQAPKGSKD